MLIGASLKMYFSHAATRAWVAEVADVVAAHPARSSASVFVIPQYPSIPAALELAGDLAVGAQDVAAEDAGPYTGEVSAAVLAEIGCRYAEVGHAERRRLFGDTDAVVAAKTHAALRHGLVPVVCVGEEEPLAPQEAAELCSRQVSSALADAEAAGTGGGVVVAYEPLWAIGAPAPADDDHIRGVCSRLREHLGRTDRPTSLVYGGSAGPGLLTRVSDSVDGLFLGRLAHDPTAVRDILDEVGALTA